MVLQGLGELRALVNRVTESALNAGHCQGSKSRYADVHGLVISQVLEEVGATLVKLSRQHNERHAFRRNIPDEIWCMIWALLPIPDLVVVASVCYSWRTLAISTPRLWRNLDFRCRGASESEGYGEDNLAEVLLCIARSGTHPLNLCADVSYGGPSRQCAVLALRDALAPQVARLVSVRFVSHDLNSRLLFFSAGLARLPALRALFIQTGGLTTHWNPELEELEPSTPTDLLALQELYMCGAGEVPPQPLPALVSLRFQYGRVQDVVGYLSNAPMLRHLRMCAGVYPADELTQEMLLKRALSVPAHAPPSLRVEVDSLELQSEAFLLAMFGDAERAELRLDYDTLGSTRNQPAAAFPDLQILRHIKKPCEVSGVVERDDCRTNRPLLALSVTGDGDKKRTLGVPWHPVLERDLREARFFELCDYLESPPESMTLDAHLWALLKPNSDIAAFLQRLTLRLSPATDNLTTSIPRGTDFAALEEVRVEGQGPDPGTVILVQVFMIAAFLRSLRPHGRVPRLVLNRLVLSGAVEELRDCCANVVGY